MSEIANLKSAQKALGSDPDVDRFVYNLIGAKPHVIFGEAPKPRVVAEYKLSRKEKKELEMRKKELGQYEGQLKQREEELKGYEKTLKDKETKLAEEKEKLDKERIKYGDIEKKLEIAEKKYINFRNYGIDMVESKREPKEKTKTKKIKKKHKK